MCDLIDVFTGGLELQEGIYPFAHYCISVPSRNMEVLSDTWKLVGEWMDTVEQYLKSVTSNRAWAPIKHGVEEASCRLPAVLGGPFSCWVIGRGWVSSGPEWVGRVSGS